MWIRYRGDGVVSPPVLTFLVNMPLLITLLALMGLVVVLLLIVGIYQFIRHSIRQSDDELILAEENQAYLELNSDEQELYFQSRDYISNNPAISGELSLSQKLSIQEQGILAYTFTKDAMLTNNDLIIINKTELNFFKAFECNAVTNLPIAMLNEVYYFEAKIYLKPETSTMISVGLSTKPYPWFRLPGRHPDLVVYDLDGHRRHNQPFPFTDEAPFPELIEGDVVGIGYRVRLGTVFFTRNGKKVKEQKLGGHIRNFKPGNQAQLFPIIGANNMCSVHVNLGQMGFVFIEANVKKWGYAPLEGNGPAPPAYNKFNTDILLDRLEIDEDELSERGNDFPPDFWQTVGDDEDKFSYNAYAEENNSDRITLSSLIPNEPPTYEGTTNIEHEDAVQGETRDESTTSGDDTNIPSLVDGEDARLEVNENLTPEELHEGTSTLNDAIQNNSDDDSRADSEDHGP
ncbi:hypothetical protein JNB11_02235 [Kocuria palustris]|nr:hypothetical protein [Kocuria palustris]